MYLLDTNIWLERLLNQAKAQDVKRLLDRVEGCLPANSQRRYFLIPEMSRIGWPLGCSRVREGECGLAGSHLSLTCFEGFHPLLSRRDLRCGFG